MALKKPPAKGDQTRSAIIDAAYVLFTDRGYHGTSMREIARRAGLALGGIYNHFDGKEAIFLAVIRAYHPYRGMVAALGETAAPSAEIYFRQAARQMVSTLQRDPRVLNLMLIELIEFEAKHVPELATEILPQLAAGFSQSQRYRDELRPLLPPVMMRAFLGLFFSYYITDMLVSKTPLAGLDIDWLGGMVDIYLHGVVAPRPEA